MSLIFSELEPGQIDGLWPKYVYGLQEFINRWPRNVEWKLDDVKQAIKKDTARMVNVYDGKNQLGFLVYRKFNEEFSKAKYIHVWICFMIPKYRGRIRDYLPDTMAFLKKVSNKIGAKYIEFDSPRRGWEKIITRFSMNPNRVVYRMEVML